MSISGARTLAHELRGQTEKGMDPRVQEQRQKAELAAHDAEMAIVVAARALTVGEVWPLYMKHSRPKRRDAWKPRYRADLEAMAAPGDVDEKKNEGRA